MRRGYRPGIPVEPVMYPRRYFPYFVAVALALFLTACSTMGALLGDEVRFTPR